MSKQFASVFSPPDQGGPHWAEVKQPRSRRDNVRPIITAFPNWNDIRNPGNTNANESAKEIMRRWDTYRTKRFEIFMEQFYRGNTPWRKEWLDKTAPNFKEQEGKIIKCKMELIKRLMIIKMTGPSSLEDWILLFLYSENELDLPSNIQELMFPPSSIVSDEEFFTPKAPTSHLDRQYIYPSNQMINSPANMTLPSIHADMVLYSLKKSWKYPRIRYGLTGTNFTEAEAARNEELGERYEIFPKGASYSRQGVNARNFTEYEKDWYVMRTGANTLVFPREETVMD